MWGCVVPVPTGAAVLRSPDLVVRLPSAPAATGGPFGVGWPPGGGIRGRIWSQNRPAGDRGASGGPRAAGWVRPEQPGTAGRYGGAGAAGSGGGVLLGRARYGPLRPIAHTPTLTQTYPRNYAVSRYSICRVPSLHRPRGQIHRLLKVGQRVAAGSSSVGAPGVILLARIPDPGFSHDTPAPGGGVCAGDRPSRPKTEMGRAPENARPATEETEQ